MRGWLIALTSLGLISAAGCGGESRGGVVSTTLGKMSQTAQVLSNIRDRVNDFVKNKDAGKEAEAQKDIIAAVEEAKQLEKTAKEWQNLISGMASQTPATDEEKKELLKKYQKEIDQVTISLKDAHREMKAAVTAANEKYKDSLRPLMVKLNDAEGDFAQVVRKK